MFPCIYIYWIYSLKMIYIQWYLNKRWQCATSSDCKLGERLRRWRLVPGHDGGKTPEAFPVLFRSCLFGYCRRSLHLDSNCEIFFSVRQHGDTARLLWYRVGTGSWCTLFACVFWLYLFIFFCRSSNFPPRGLRLINAFANGARSVDNVIEYHLLTSTVGET